MEALRPQRIMTMRRSCDNKLTKTYEILYEIQCSRHAHGLNDQEIVINTEKTAPFNHLSQGDFTFLSAL